MTTLDDIINDDKFNDIESWNFIMEKINLAKTDETQELDKRSLLTIFVNSPRSNNLDIVKQLYTTYYADNINIEDFPKQTILHVAGRYAEYNYDIIEFLLNEGANPKLFDYNDKNCFMYASQYEEYDILRLLLNYV